MRHTNYCTSISEVSPIFLVKIILFPYFNLGECSGSGNEPSQCVFRSRGRNELKQYARDSGKNAAVGG